MSETILRIVRQPSTDEGTFGTLTLPDGKTFHTLECPWRNNTPRLSCIPAGTYRVIPHKSPKFGSSFWVQNVPGRSEILFHAGNWAGDTTKGLRSDSLGCILVGSSVAVIKGQRGVSASRVAMDQLLSLQKSEFTLEITEA